MKKILMCCIALCAAAFVATPARALPGIKIGLEVRAGMNFTNFKMKEISNLSVSQRTGYHFALAVPLMAGPIGVQPELVYAHNAFDIEDQRVKVNNFELPLLFTWKVFGPLRLHVGPSFALADKSSYADTDEFVPVGNTKATVSYVAGLSLNLWKVIVDARYNGAFKSTKNYYEGGYYKMRTQGLYLSVGYKF